MQSARSQNAKHAFRSSHYFHLQVARCNQTAAFFFFFTYYLKKKRRRVCNYSQLLNNHNQIHSGSWRLKAHFLLFASARKFAKIQSRRASRIICDSCHASVTEQVSGGILQRGCGQFITQCILLPGNHKEDTADPCAGQQHVHPDVRRQGIKEGEYAWIGAVWFPVQDADA